MIRSLRFAIAVAAATALSVVFALSAVAATAPRGTLTSAEYSQLTAEQVAFAALERKKDVTWNELYATCRKVGRSTQLLASVRNNCETGLGFDQSLDGFFADFERCNALSTSTTTTATTTTGTGTTTTTTGTGTATTGTGTTTTSGTLTQPELELYACLQPEYEAISRATKSIDSAQKTLRQRVLARDFRGRCELTLAPTRTQLRALERFVATSRQLARDVALITKVADGQEPQSAIDEAQIAKDAAAFNAAGKAFAKLRRPQKLSVCPHQ